MKLTTSGIEHNVHRIIKTKTDIIGYDELGSEQFSFKGVSDMSLFRIVDDYGQEHSAVDLPVTSIPTLEERQAAVEAAIMEMAGEIYG